jgi:hypothetical protein
MPKRHTKTDLQYTWRTLNVRERLGSARTDVRTREGVQRVECRRGLYHKRGLCSWYNENCTGFAQIVGQL